MRKSLAAICAALMLVLVIVPIAHAATEVNVRIEGKEETLFEKTIPVTIHKIEASSDTQERNCDGINELDPENTEPEITPTLASAEAMESIGETFDGEWYDGFGDYFITRFGPDEQDNNLSAWWGILVNNVFTSVGGCQRQLHQGDEVLWIWNAFSARPMLALYPKAAHYVEGSRPERVVAQPGEPIPLEVVSWGEGGEGHTPEIPSREGSSPYEGASIAPVTVNEKGFQRLDVGSPETVVSNAEGKATVTYDKPGVYRIKATVGAVPGIEETAVRSNGLEICVPAKHGDCGEAPLPSAETKAASAAPTTPAPGAAPKIGKAKFDRGALDEGQLKLSWPVLDPGAGVRGFKVGVKPIGVPGGWTTRAHGTTATEATVRLGLGRSFQLRLTVVDQAGNATTYGLGTVTVP
jgi:hypothetical protein